MAKRYLKPGVARGWVFGQGLWKAPPYSLYEEAQAEPGLLYLRGVFRVRAVQARPKAAAASIFFL